MKLTKAGASRKVKAIPEGYHTVTPFIIVKGAAELLEFMTNAFGALELGRMLNEQGKITHAETKIGDSIIIVFDAKDQWPENTCLSSHLCRRLR